MKDILLIGCGAMGRSVLEGPRDDAQARVRYVLERPSRAGKLQDELGSIQVLRSLGELDPARRAKRVQLDGAVMKAERSCSRLWSGISLASRT